MLELRIEVMMKRALCLWLSAALLATTARAEESAAQYVYLVDTTTHTVLMDKNGSEKMHPSSMSKLMTIYIVFQRLKEGRLKLDSTFPVSENAWRMQGSKMFVPINTEVNIEDLIHGVIVQSGNDACIVLAEGISGSEEAFAKEMNRVAQEIGLQDSHFANSTGWPDENHLMSSRDLARLAERIITDFPEYYHYFSVLEYTYHNIKQHNRNRLINTTIGVDGLKTGHTEQAGYGITLSAKQGDRRLILVINGLESDNARVAEGDRLLRYGFREFENKTLFTKDQTVSDAEVWLGSHDKVSLVSQEDVVLTLPVTGAKTTKFTVKYQGPIAAPITKGQHIADLLVTTESGLAKTVPLVAGADVGKRSVFGRVWPAFEYYVLGRHRVPAAAVDAK
ncbi:MAG: D-alanyl-D-alanine carboxypeptidase family protein [Rickettsiales bacterium]|nr:D-alanyl-D-alanine carboxypeptidase family protein [Rickettsiales bacterium]